MNRKMTFILLALSVITMPFMSCNDDSDEALPEGDTTEIRAFIKQKYPDAIIGKIEKEDNRVIEADILHENKAKEVVFDLKNNWLYTSWDISIVELPETVSNILKEPKYTGYRIDDADYMETSQGDYYILELEKGEIEVKVRVAETGEVLD